MRIFEWLSPVSDRKNAFFRFVHFLAKKLLIENYLFTHLCDQDVAVEDSEECSGMHGIVLYCIVLYVRRQWVTVSG
jgi:hypothetical protein